MKTLLNPFSVQLKKHHFIDVNENPIYSNGDYHIYKLYEKHYLYTFKNIIFAERCDKRLAIVENLINGSMPPKNTREYFDFVWPKETIKFGIEYAKKINFSIN